jgi:hypothetical protein
VPTNFADFYAGLFGAVLVPEVFDLGHGVIISRTYAHLFAPFMMAFSPAPPGKHHPAPWKSAKGGLELDITTQLFLPAGTSAPELDRINTVWWIVALLRLHSSALISVPIISSEAFSSIPAMKDEPRLWPVEIHTPRLFPDGWQVRSIDTQEIEWLRDNWYDAAELLKHADFRSAFEAIDLSTWNHTPIMALVAVWGALERLFSASTTELSYRVSSNIAAFLEPPGRARYALFKRIRGLYNSRSKAAHGAGETNVDAYAETYSIARRVLLMMIEKRHVPDRNELEANVFGDSVGITPGPPSEQ